MDAVQACHVVQVELISRSVSAQAVPLPLSLQSLSGIPQPDQHAPRPASMSVCNIGARGLAGIQWPPKHLGGTANTHRAAVVDGPGQDSVDDGAIVGSSTAASSSAPAGLSISAALAAGLPPQLPSTVPGVHRSSGFAQLPPRPITITSDQPAPQVEARLSPMGRSGPNAANVVSMVASQPAYSLVGPGRVLVAPGSATTALETMIMSLNTAAPQQLVLQTSYGASAGVGILTGSMAADVYATGVPTGCSSASISTIKSPQEMLPAVTGTAAPKGFQSRIAGGAGITAARGRLLHSVPGPAAALRHAHSKRSGIPGTPAGMPGKLAVPHGHACRDGKRARVLEETGCPCAGGHPACVHA